MEKKKKEKKVVFIRTHSYALLILLWAYMEDDFYIFSSPHHC